MGIEDKILKRFDEHREWAEKRFDKIDREISGLNQFRWRLTGGSVMLSAVIASLYELLKHVQTLTWKQ